MADDAGAPPQQSTPDAGAPPQQPTVNQAIKTEADQLVGQASVGDGECYALADKVLKDSGARSAPTYGQITPTADYVWGNQVDLKLVQPGDILQFRNHEFTTVTVTKTTTTRADGSTYVETQTQTETHKRPHHTAVVSATAGNGVMTVVEQHVIDPNTQKTSNVVRQNTLITNGSKTVSPAQITVQTDPLGQQSTVTVEKTVTTTVTGTIWAYRPQK
jgi:hypothetical protein